MHLNVPLQGVMTTRENFGSYAQIVKFTGAGDTSSTYICYMFRNPVHAIFVGIRKVCFLYLNLSNRWFIIDNVINQGKYEA
jgi:hypothetical protein